MNLLWYYLLVLLLLYGRTKAYGEMQAVAGNADGEGNTVYHYGKFPSLRLDIIRLS